MINALNHFGYSIGYHIAEELETNLAKTVCDRKVMTPDGIQLKAGLGTGLAIDNYDENTETLSGSGTLHDTVGITYQKKEDINNNVVDVQLVQDETNVQILMDQEATIQEEPARKQ